MSCSPYSPNDYKTDLKPVWCPGCGDFAVLNSVYRALADLHCEPHETVVVSGIGCSSRLPGYVETYGFNSLHGRALPIATGVKLAPPNLTVLAVGGDGDGIAIGGNHFMHAARRNVDIAYFMMDNEIYGLTKGAGRADDAVRRQDEVDDLRQPGSRRRSLRPGHLPRRDVGRPRLLRRREGNDGADEAGHLPSRLRVPQHHLAMRHLARRRSAQGAARDPPAARRARLRSEGCRPAGRRGGSSREDARRLPSSRPDRAAGRLPSRCRSSDGRCRRSERRRRSRCGRCRASSLRSARRRR